MSPAISTKRLASSTLKDTLQGGYITMATPTYQMVSLLVE
jgi:hypothetical protein